jgi:uncharacterized protein (TIGR02246 family)
MGLTVEDHLEIQGLMARYNQAVDSGDGSTFADTFTEDGALDAMGSVFEGRAALKSFADAVPSAAKEPRHIATNVIIEGDGDRARIRAYLQMYALMGEPARQQVAASGRYDDELAKVDGSWRFVRRTFTPDR